ncbi:MAG: hypothetical protein P8Y97_04535 [Candidatus Lokiarchaeota archaeon]
MNLLNLIYKNFNNNKLKFNIKFITCSIFIIFIILSGVSLIKFRTTQIDNNNTICSNDEPKNLKNSGQDNVIFQGNLPPINITDYGNLYKTDQHISLTSENLKNVSYFLDDPHNWEASKIEANISNIQDTRDWVNKGGNDEIPVYRFDQEFDNIPINPGNHNYTNNLSNDPLDPNNIHSNINQTDALAIRLHFNRFEIESNFDYLFIYDENNQCCYTDTGIKNDFYSPWIKANELKITIFSDSSVNLYGYYIDFYEYINDTVIFNNNLKNWEFQTSSLLKQNYGIGEMDNETGMYLSLYGYPDDTYDFASLYFENDYAEFSQNLSIPRGSVTNAYLSFDYYAESAMETNENYIYIEVNNEKVYSIGLRDVVRAGRNIWHNTGEINMDLWVNTTNIFQNDISQQNLNISVGIMSGTTVYYSGFEDRYQQVIWFDNISLILTTIANATQEGIDLSVNSENFDCKNNWGYANKTLQGIWSTNPIFLTFSTTSPQLSFDLDTRIFATHKVTSKIDQLNQQGISYKILSNGSIYWEFLHNLYKPDQYTNFEFLIEKPKEWKIISMLDPTLQTRYFEGGAKGDDFVKVNATEAIYPGWWKISATSDNYLNSSNINLLKNGMANLNLYKTSDNFSISAKVGYLNYTPSKLNSTYINLNVYFPNGSLWYFESKKVQDSGFITFSNKTLTPNLLGGNYSYTLFWTNGTLLGGIKSYFLIIHNSTMDLLKPNDALIDFKSETYFGDLIPLKIQYTDMENGRFIEDGSIFYNWSTGKKYLEQSTPGVFEATIDTSELPSNGLFKILIRSSCEGFTNYSFVLNLLVQFQTDLQRLESESKVQIHNNSTIKFRYLDEFDNGISNAYVSLSNINSSYYRVEDHLDGNYTIYFNTEFISEIGVYQIQFNFSAFGYESQFHVFRFEIIQKELSIVPVNFGETIEVNKGHRLDMQLQFQDPVNGEFITGANASYFWDYGLGKLTEDNGIYELNILLPDSISGSKKINILVNVEGGIYKTKQYSFIITIVEPPQPNYWMWIILSSSVGAIVILGSLSFRSYIIIPRRKKKQRKILAKTQKFKDLQNIEAIVLIHRYSGIPVFLKSYSILEDSQKELFSGFIQAITSISREFTEEKIQTDKEYNNGKKYGVNKLIELDFKYFYCLIADKDDIRIVLILKEKGSNNLKEQIGYLADGILLNLSAKFDNWDGSLDQFERLVPPIINEYFDLYYKEPFQLNDPIKIAKTRNEVELTSMQTRVLNVIYSIVKNKKNFNLEYILDLVYEEDKNLVIIALESLIDRKIIIPAED